MHLPKCILIYLPKIYINSYLPWVYKWVVSLIQLCYNYELLIFLIHWYHLGGGGGWVACFIYGILLSSRGHLKVTFDILLIQLHHLISWRGLVYVIQMWKLAQKWDNCKWFATYIPCLLILLGLLLSGKQIPLILSIGRNIRPSLRRSLEGKKQKHYTCRW